MYRAQVLSARLTVVGGLALLGSALDAVAQCDTGEVWDNAQISCGTCSGGNPTQTIYCEQPGLVRRATTCLDNGWASSVSSWATFPVSSEGQCELAGAGGPPACMPQYATLWYHGIEAGKLVFKRSVRNAGQVPSCL